MTLDQIKLEISRLTLADKLSLVEDTWDLIADNPGELPMPDWQRRELDDRLNAYKEGQVELRDWQPVHQSIRNRAMPEAGMPALQRTRYS